MRKLTPEEKEQRKVAARERAKAWSLANPERKKENDRKWREANLERKHATDKAWRQSHLERKRETNRAWAAANPEKVKAYKRGYEERNRERLNEAHRDYYRQNHEKEIERGRKYRENNLEKKRESARLWARRNPGSRRAVQHARRCRLVDQPGLIEASRDDAAIRIALFKGKCAYCNQAALLELDHFHAIAAGGRHVLSNLVPACRACNASKGSRPVEQWFRAQAFFTESRWKSLQKLTGGNQLSFI